MVKIHVFFREEKALIYWVCSFYTKDETHYFGGLKPRNEDTYYNIYGEENGTSSIRILEGEKGHPDVESAKKEVEALVEDMMDYVIKHRIAYDKDDYSITL